MLRVFFPRLYNPDTGVVELSGDQKAQFYNHGLLPAVRRVDEDTLTNWPVNYQSALTRAHKGNNQYQYGTRPISHHLVPSFGRHLKRKLAQHVEWGADIVFMTQVQGVKEANQHTPGSRFQAHNALTNFLTDFDEDVLGDGDSICYIDVGLEFSEPNMAYQWRTDSHHRLLMELTPLPLARCIRRTQLTNRHYARDYSSGLMHISGCRVEMGDIAGEDDPVYLQAYTTDKALIQQHHRNRFSLTMQHSNALKGTPPKFMEDLYTLYFDAKDRHDCAARVEVRLPFHRAAEDALEVGPEILEKTLCVFDREDWW